MVLETDPILFANWIGPALLHFLQAALILGAIALVGGFLVSAFRYGPTAGGDATFRMLKRGLSDLFSISPRRILALAWLAVQESIRRRVMVGFGIFLLILLFAGWFLDTKSNDPAKLYLSFVLTATTYLVLLMALFLSVFSLPADIKNKTIYTIVTKPVRPGEIVLGRILGFSMIGTMMLAAMGIFSYVFVVRVLNHTHEVEVAGVEETLEPVATSAPDSAAKAEAAAGQEKPAATPASPSQQTKRTTAAQNHRHEVTLDAEGQGSTNIVNGHWHEVDAMTAGDKTTYVVGPPQGLFMARVPSYGELRFLDRTGGAKSRGISVGNEWKYRSFIDGATLAAAIWTFSDITPARFPDGLPIEMTIRVFRSHKGDIEKGIQGTLQLQNPRTKVKSAIESFRAKDFTADQINIPRKLLDTNGRTIDLFDDLVDDGQIEIVVQCLEDAQYFGVAKADLYLRARDASFTANFVKGYVGIWVRMLLVTSFGVMFSTFLSGPVAMMATLAALLIGSSTTFINGVAAGTIQGGGPVESFIRIVQQRNATTKLEDGLTRDVVQSADAVFMTVMTTVTNLLPNFRGFDNVDYVAHGFDIPPDVVLVQFFTGLGFVAAVFAIGYFFLRTREVAR